MTKKEFEAYLKSIGGLVNGYFTNKGPIMDAYFFSIGPGWYLLVKNLIQELIAMGWNKKICQVKEKFSGLRFYTNTVTDEMSDAISKFEEMSFKICETCGDPGDPYTTVSGWMRTSCSPCALKQNLKKEQYEKDE